MLKATRNVSFEQVEECMRNGEVLDDYDMLPRSIQA